MKSSSVAQGGKRVLLGEEVFRYDPGHYLIFTVDLPVVFQVEGASEELPYLGLRLDLDPTLVASTWTRRVRGTVWIMKTRRTLAASTKSCSALRRSATSLSSAATWNLEAL